MQNMSHIRKYDSYQSIRIGGDNISIGMTPAREAAVDTARSTTGGKRYALPLCLIASLAAIGFVLIDRPALLLSSQYAEIVQDNVPQVPLLGSKYNKIRASNIAEQYKIHGLLEDDDDDDDDNNGKKKKRKSHSHKTPPKTPLGCEATVVLLRHCEKTDEYEHCNYVGYERAAFLPSLFGDGKEKWPTPSYIYALNPGGRETEWKKNFREIELILPLAEKVNVTIDANYNTETTSHLAKHIHGMLKSGEMCGKLAVISWKHQDLPKLARRLGCGPVEGCPIDYRGSTFDQVWQIKFVYRIPLHPTTKKEAKRDITPKKPRWWIYGSTQMEGFDPLQYSKLSGDYPKGGKEKGASWMFDFENDKRWKAIDEAKTSDEEAKLKKIERLGDFY